MGRQQGRPPQRMGQFREKGLRARRRRIQSISCVLSLRNLQILAARHAPRNSGIATLHLQRDEFQSQKKVEIGVSQT